MRIGLEDYRGFVDDEVIGEIYKKARQFYGKHILHINSTYEGGGVSEMLVSLVPLMNTIGLDVGWRILHGDQDFFTVTKDFHNALQGAEIKLTRAKKRMYVENSEKFSVFTHIHHDFVVIHDPQPLPIIRYYKKRQPWMWRCHIDLTKPHTDLWNFLKGFMLRYDAVVFSSDKYKKKDLPIEQKIVSPAIDPLAPKNREISEKKVLEIAKRNQIPLDKPIIAQVARMDPWKDPEGLLEAFKMVKSKVDCRLLFCYNLAPDDPQGVKIQSRVYRKSKKLAEKGEVLFVIGNNDTLVNAVQRLATVIAQKSKKEGFCLSVTEALWKEKAVVATNVGGIPTQITDGENGFMVDPEDTKGFANRIIELLKKPKLCGSLGEKGRETVREKFLITRLLTDYLNLFGDLI
jgi:trehalose synthase